MAGGERRQDEAVLHRNASDAARHFGLSPERLVEIGRVVEI